MDVPEYVEQLRRDGERLATVASFTDPGAPVPTCPDWSLRDLVHHVGGVHRWATGFVRGAGRQPPDGDLERFVGGWPIDSELVVWFADGHRVLAESLASAPADLETWTFLEAPTPLAFWARRQAHETATHRVDAESAGGEVTGFPSGFSVDGIDELLLRFANRPGRTLPVETMRSMALRVGRGEQHVRCSGLVHPCQDRLLRANLVQHEPEITYTALEVRWWHVTASRVRCRVGRGG